MQMWEKKSEDKSHRTLGLIVVTRWWDKDQALTKVFRCFGDPKDALYVDLLLTLGVVEGDYDETMTSLVRAKAKEISYSMR